MTSERTMENQNAVQKPAMWKLGTIAAASMINSAFMTSEKIPSVKMVIGSAMSFTTGLMSKLITPSTIAKMTAPSTVTVAPGTRYTVTRIAIMETMR